MAGRPSMADVAALAGVSAQTVSRVVNGSPRVDPATRARVEAAMQQSGYRVHRAARALRTGRSGTIGAVVSTLATVGNSLMLEAVSDAASARGYDVAVVTLGSDDVASAFERLQGQGVDGVVVINEASALAHSAELPSALRFAVVDSPPDDRYTGVETDHFGGAAAATRHLLGLGHRTVAHIAGPATSYASAERERGWRETLVRAGREVAEPVHGGWTSASGYDAATALLESGAMGTALFVANDQMALGALRALSQRGARVPEDVSVVGFDDVADAANYQPPLTTVRQHFDRLGEQAVTVLLDGAERRPGHPQRTVIPATLIERASTAPPPPA
ncbi:LacI family DNA-binding transcriptional regulator [Microbacterium sp. SORGH_AS_0888]|uniref:LacI family DNA-binding transcriptional regulator n=1 Tax=Microbacterium sp. SORGH_AS_0888 TaxID=3041791 RepID=UPI0027838CC4|nr:LacI family DNA-binding transcriptional regulator [Microbacterium sp. SORGH_AS_0888]MDQ1130345.1 DNA-binding LacI/PurR family transcriptional regulator [Microbacterium sp. SORGH_AS_0888]